MESGWLVALAALVALGVIFLYQRSRQSAQLAKLGAVQEQLQERTLELERVTQNLNRLAGIDPLTQVSNHSGLTAFLKQEWQRALRDATALSVVIVDIDHFSGYNDSLGNQAGDRCLVKVGEAIKTVTRRPGDLVSRFGGEEFAIVLTRTDHDGAAKLAQKIKTAVDSLQPEHPTSPVAKHVTVSIGLATASPAVDLRWGDRDLIAAATRALAEAKQSGRNMIVSAADLSD